MISIKFFLKTPKKPKSPIYVRVHLNGKELVPVSIGHSVKTGWNEGKQIFSGGEWNHEKQLVKAGNDFSEELNAKIERLRVAIGKAFHKIQDEGGNPTDFDLKRIINPRKANSLNPDKTKKPKTISEYYKAWGDWYRAGNKRTEEGIRKANDYVRGFKQIVDKVELFLPGALLTDFLQEQTNLRGFGLIDEFEEWVKDNYTLEDNTIVRYRKPFRAFLKFANLPYQWLTLGERNAPTKYALEWDEIIQLDKAKYSSDDIEKSAHISLMICQLGLRWSDFSNIKDMHFREIKTERHGKVWVVDKSQGKTGNQILIPIPPLALKYLKKYNFRIPLPVTKYSKKTYRHVLSDFMKDAAKEAKLNRMIRITKSYDGVPEESFHPIHEIFSPHDCRHTGATLVRIASKSPDLQRIFLGHKEQGATSMYDHVPPEIIADDLLDAWAYFDKKSQ